MAAFLFCRHYASDIQIKTLWEIARVGKRRASRQSAGPSAPLLRCKNKSPEAGGWTLNDCTDDGEKRTV